MTTSEVILGLVVIVIGYLLGSIPSAYLITRFVKKVDIRQLGGGNVGGLNVFREVGPWPALAVGLADLGKGAAAVAIAQLAMAVPDIFVLLASIASAGESRSNSEKRVFLASWSSTMASTTSSDVATAVAKLVV